MHATDQAQRDTQVDRWPNEDGTWTTLTVKTEQRPAAGSITIDDRTLNLYDASLLHFLMVEMTR
jgi:hypothetical protein